MRIFKKAICFLLLYSLVVFGCNWLSHGLVGWAYGGDYFQQVYQQKLMLDNARQWAEKNHVPMPNVVITDPQPDLSPPQNVTQEPAFTYDMDPGFEPYHDPLGDMGRYTEGE